MKCRHELSGVGFKMRFSDNWIISPKYDLTWFMGSAIAGYMIFYMYAGLGWNMIAVWLVWVICLDSPHFFATYSRTYFDKEERRTRPQFLYGSLATFAVGPVAVLAAYLLHKAQSEHYMLPWNGFKIFVSLWAYWHITRQHYGFMKLYQRKNNERGERDLRLDSLLLYGALLLPFLALIARHPSARGRVDLPKDAAPFPSAWSEFGVFMPSKFFDNLTWEHWIVIITAAITLVLVILFIGRQWMKYRYGEAINLPKILYLLAVIPLHAFMCYNSAMLSTGLLTFTVIVTIYHDIQYLAIVWFYHRNRYHKTSGATARFGMAPRLSTSLWLFMGVAILLSVPLWAYGCAIHRIPLGMCEAIPHVGTQTFLGSEFEIVFFICLTAGLQMHHYVLDQVIWRPSRSQELRSDLQLEAA